MPFERAVHQSRKLLRGVQAKADGKEQEQMKLTKTSKKTYDVTFFPTDLDFTFGEFREIREKRGSMKKRFEKCFICGHKFADDEVPVLIGVSGI